MSDDEADDAAETIEPAAATAKPGGRKKMVIGAVAALVLLGGGSGAYFFLSGDDKADATEQVAEADAEPPVFIDVPPMVVNLRSADGAARFVKLRFMLVPGPEGEAAVIEKKLPLLLDAYQPFLRELRPEDLAGSAAVFRIKEEMLVRARDVLGAGQVKDVLIQVLIQQ